MWPLFGDVIPPPIIFEHATEGQRPVKEEENLDSGNVAKENN